MTVSIGLVGAGNISETHARTAQSIPGVEIAAVYGANQEKAAALAAKVGAAVYHDFSRFLKHRPMEMVAIGSPSGLHAEQAIAAARCGLHVLIEKPVDISVERVDALLDETGRAGVHAGVFFQDRLRPDVLTIKAFLDAGRLGTPVLASGRVKWYRPPDYYEQSRWRGRWALDGGGALMNQGIHTADLLLCCSDPSCASRRSPQRVCTTSRSRTRRLPSSSSRLARSACSKRVRQSLQDTRDDSSSQVPGHADSRERSPHGG